VHQVMHLVVAEPQDVPKPKNCEEIHMTALYESR
jgi:hypothetical protein